MKLSEIKLNPDNPRLIKDDKFEKLCQSIKEFPEMMPLKPIVIDENNMILAGNMRFKALKELKYKEIPDEWVKRADELTEEQKREFIIKDNVGFGEWNFEMLQDWGEDLEDWGVDIPSHWNNDLISENNKQIFNKWFINIEFDSEEECQKQYDKFLNDGLKCKIVQ